MMDEMVSGQQDEQDGTVVIEGGSPLEGLRALMLKIRKERQTAEDAAFLDARGEEMFLHTTTSAEGGGFLSLFVNGEGALRSPAEAVRMPGGAEYLHATLVTSGEHGLFRVTARERLDGTTAYVIEVGVPLEDAKGNTAIVWYGLAELLEKPDTELYVEDGGDSDPDNTIARRDRALREAVAGAPGIAAERLAAAKAKLAEVMAERSAEERAMSGEVDEVC